MAITADTDNALITIDNDLREYLGIADDDTTYDDKLQAVINAFSKFANNYTGRKLKARDLTEYYDGTGTDTLFVDNYPINSVTSLNIDTGRDYDADSLIDSGDYSLYGDVGKIVLDNTIFSGGAQSVKIVYNGGYSSIPWDLQEAAREFLASVWNRDKKDLLNVSSISVEGQSIAYDIKAVPEFTREVLDQYRRPPHG